MDAFIQWITQHPAEAAWALFATLTALVTVYYRLEPSIKRYVEATTVKWDDEAFQYVQQVGRTVKWLVGLLALLLPAIAGPRPAALQSDDDRTDGDPTPRLGTHSQQQYREEKRK
jgi:hypothetical protein